jgi:hypothetical protein
MMNAGRKSYYIYMYNVYIYACVCIYTRGSVILHAKLTVNLLTVKSLLLFYIEKTDRYSFVYIITAHE